jgi:hypothetical protein
MFNFPEGAYVFNVSLVEKPAGIQIRVNTDEYVPGRIKRFLGRYGSELGRSGAQSDDRNINTFAASHDWLPPCRPIRG